MMRREGARSSLRKTVQRQGMIVILKRVHEHVHFWEAELEDDILEDNSDERSTSGEQDYTLNSDVEQDLLDLKTRLQNVNIEGRQEFETLIKNGDAEMLLLNWVPWGTCHLEN
ncbi:Uncharacterized protein DBV15_10592 [Temnothorax longispinosus]|uniref:Uncharacterized protein n=1 Tax=Temnothorax longispinosus TaxID=300112 RepID=A0A4S2JSM6_9HYME|nr:Uncharacterized protein DBV15_10592 [Temnothorax longispinosus]